MRIPSFLIVVAVLFTTFSFLRADDTVEVSEFTFHYGEPWLRQQTTSSMRAAQFLYEFKDMSNENVELVIFFFGQRGGGGVEANIARWLTQFDGTPESKTEEKDFNGTKVTLLTATGTYLDTMGGAAISSTPKVPKEDYTLLAAIFTSEKGDVFIKATGPTPSINAMRADFDKFIASPFEKK